MRSKWPLLVLWAVFTLIAGCGPATGREATTAPTAIAEATQAPAPAARPADTATLPPEVTRPAPTPPPGSTDVPWWGGRIAALDAEPGSIGKPTGLVLAADGSLYSADARAHRILHLDAQGHVLHAWGTPGQSSEGAAAPAGTFNEPWGLAVGPDGSVYVADTWNHRIQKFDGTGRFLLAWGEPCINCSGPYGLFGPRDVVVSRSGLVLVSDTGNKRVVVYDQAGQYVGQAGGAGAGPGQFDEPVGLALDASDRLYVADQWNRRVQVFALAPDGGLTWQAAWPVDGWQMNTPEYKPFLCSCLDRIFLTDPETGSVQEVSPAGEKLRTYDINSLGTLNPGITYGIACDPAGALWVSDSIGGLGVLVRIVPQP